MKLKGKLWICLLITTIWSANQKNNPSREKRKYVEQNLCKPWFSCDSSPPAPWVCVQLTGGPSALQKANGIYPASKTFVSTLSSATAQLNDRPGRVNLKYECHHQHVTDTKTSLVLLFNRKMLQLLSHLVGKLGSQSQFTYICDGLSRPLNVESNRSWCCQSLFTYSNKCDKIVASNCSNCKIAGPREGVYKCSDLPLQWFPSLCPIRRHLGNPNSRPLFSRLS